MFKKTRLPIILCLSILLAACGAKAMPAATEKAATLPASTSTPDPCSMKNLPDEIKKVDDLTREFDDYSTLASSVAQAQLVQIIPDMQRILRAAEDQQIPACLKPLKQLQTLHMSAVLQTLLLFISAADASSVERVNAGIIQSRELHSKYDVERARLLGVTLEAVPTLAAMPASPIAAANITVTNVSAVGINLRSAPDINASAAGILGAQATTMAFGKTANDQWIQVEIPDKPGRRAWVFAQLIVLSAPLAQLPVVTQ